MIVELLVGRYMKIHGKQSKLLDYPCVKNYKFLSYLVGNYYMWCVRFFNNETYFVMVDPVF